MPNNTSDPRKELARRNVRMALLHVVLATGLFALFFYVQVFQ